MLGNRSRMLSATLLAMTVVVVAGGCSNDNSSDTAASTSSTSASSSTSAPSAKTLVLQAKDNNSKQTIAVGDSVSIQLETAGGSGYTWKMTKEPDAMVLETVSTTQATSTPAPPTSAGQAPMVGRPETVTTVLRGKAPGTTSLTLSHVPPGNGPAEGTFTVEITVTAGNGSAPPRAAKEIDLHENDNGSTQTIAPGDTLAVELASTDASHTWTVTKNPDPRVVEVASTTRSTPPTTVAGARPLPGAQDAVIVLLRGINPGSTTVAIDNMPSGGGAPAGTFNLSITVTSEFAHGEAVPVKTAGADEDRSGTLTPGASAVYDVDTTTGGAGEKFDVKLTTSKGNATFVVLAPDGTVVARGDREAHYQIPVKEILRVVVTAGDADTVYKVSLGVSVPAS